MPLTPRKFAEEDVERAQLDEKDQLVKALGGGQTKLDAERGQGAKL